LARVCNLCFFQVVRAAYSTCVSRLPRFIFIKKAERLNLIQRVIFSVTMQRTQKQSTRLLFCVEDLGNVVVELIFLGKC
jgi:hypothetical protein